MPRARTSPPAKLNLFLEIPAKRDDGFHEIDTVMVAIDWRDELEIETITDPEVRCDVDWIPSVQDVAAQLGVAPDSALLEIPAGESNLVVRALHAFRSRFAISDGFHVRLRKRIPAAAGMGGASSDAAHAIMCAAQLHHVTQFRDELWEIAASIGSDVPFFLDDADSRQTLRAARATGRGEILEPITRRTSIHFVVAYPNRGLSTAEVYRRLRVPDSPISSEAFIAAFGAEEDAVAMQQVMNRLSEPALGIMPRLSDLIESLWQSDLRPCQLTGSGSACFGVARDSDHAHAVVERLKVDLQPGVLLRAVQMVAPASPIVIEPS